jgi:hypothetical protein
VTLEEIRAALAPLLRHLGKTERRLLSKREAARRLGVDRNTTLRDLIDLGDIRTAVIAGRVKIPASEIDRLCEPSPLKPRGNGSTRRADRVRTPAALSAPFSSK